MSLKKLVAVATAAISLGIGAAGVATTNGAPTKASGGETIYIRNLAPTYFSDAKIKADIPAWEQAINVDFAKYWHTAQYHLVFIGRKEAPAGANVATFVEKGPVKGALAYHNVQNGAISITVYSGTADYYGYDNSVSFTHELEEAAADPDISTLKQGWPSDYIWIEKPNGDIKVAFQMGITGWFAEVSDPVEADFYHINGVRISDFITPAWFNAGGGSRYDFMGLCQQPFWLRPGGYAQYLDAGGWEVILNFRKGHEADRGFYLGDTDVRR